MDFKKYNIQYFRIIGIIIGAQLVVNSASNIAFSWGMSENLVGLTIVSIGTSLPELVLYSGG
ncbi:MAG: hypothetical protein ACLS23_07830 [Clostridioides difficile]